MGRQALLEDSLAYARTHGIADVTLRQLAEAIGSSHRMLLYHFGSRAGLLAALVDEIESRERAATVQAMAGATDYEAVLRRGWARLRSKRRAGDERLFFELAALAARGEPGTEGFAGRFVAPWLELAVSVGASPALMRADIAVIRGLLLDLLVTRDTKGVDAAFEAWLMLRQESLADRATRSNS